jgi:hypothetical protein
MHGVPVSRAVPSLMQLARLRAALGQHDAAREIALFASRVAPSGAEARRLVAELHAASGELGVRLWALAPLADAASREGFAAGVAALGLEAAEVRAALGE